MAKKQEPRTSAQAHATDSDRAKGPPEQAQSVGGEANSSKGGDPVALLSRLAGGLAHEIKNPLSTMAINLALLEEEWNRSAASRSPHSPELSPRETRSLRRIHTLQREVQRLEQILEEFLAYVRGQEINRAPTDVGSLVRELLEFVEPEDEALGIRHHVDLRPGLPLAMLDTSAFKRAVMNLLVNARQAMPDGGELLIGLRRVGTFAELSITDTGVGMGAEDLSRCFEEYYSTKKGGTGLGLPATKRIIEEHGGSVRIQSEQGRGTRVTCMVPLMVELTGYAQPGDSAPNQPDGESE
jgi:signal transduction histidine kinase